MKEIWFSETKGDKDSRQKVKRDFEAAHSGFETLSKILNKKLKDGSVDDYSKASWAYLQADTNGWNRALKEVLKLIEGD